MILDVGQERHGLCGHRPDCAGRDAHQRLRDVHDGQPRVHMQLQVRSDEKHRDTRTKTVDKQLSCNSNKTLKQIDQISVGEQKTELQS